MYVLLLIENPRFTYVLHRYPKVNNVRRQNSREQLNLYVDNLVSAFEIVLSRNMKHNKSSLKLIFFMFFTILTIPSLEGRKIVSYQTLLFLLTQQIQRRVETSWFSCLLVILVVFLQYIIIKPECRYLHPQTKSN
jgi:hypothetical protein